MIWGTRTTFPRHLLPKVEGWNEDSQGGLLSLEIFLHRSVETNDPKEYLFEEMNTIDTEGMSSDGVNNQLLR